MGKRVLLFSLLMLFLISFSVFAVEETDLAKMDIVFEGDDLKCLVVYKQEVSSKSPSWQWFGKEGMIDGETDRILEREHFTRGDGVVCKYRDTANSIELQKTLIVPNKEPVLEVPETMEVLRGKILNIVPKVTDIDGDQIAFTFSEPFDEEGRWADTSTYAPGEYAVTVTADDGHGSVVSATVTVVLLSESEQELAELSEKRFEKEEKRIEYQTIKSSTINKKYSLIKKNETLKMENSNMNVPINLLELTFNKDILKLSFDLRSWSSDDKPRKWPTAPENVYSYVEIIKYDFSNDDLDNVKLNFNVGKTWLANYDPNTVILYKLVDEKWEQIVPTKLAESDTFIVYEAELNGLYDLAITAKQGSQPIPEPSAVKEVQIDMEEGKEPIAKVEVLENEEGDKFSTGAAVATFGEDSPKTSSRAWMWILGIIILAVAVGMIFTFRRAKKPQDISQEDIDKVVQEDSFGAENVESQQEEKQRKEDIDKELGY